MIHYVYACVLKYMLAYTDYNETYQTLTEATFPDGGVTGNF